MSEAQGAGAREWPTTIDGWLEWMVEYNHLMPWREENLRFSARYAIEGMTASLREQLAHAQKDIAALMEALGWRTDIHVPVDEMILTDAKGLRPEMAKARRRVQELECELLSAQFDIDCLTEKPSLLVKVFKRAKQAESALAQKEQQIAELQRERDRYHIALQSLTPGGSEFFGDPAEYVMDHGAGYNRHELYAGILREFKLEGK